MRKRIHNKNEFDFYKEKKIKIYLFYDCDYCEKETKVMEIKNYNEFEQIMKKYNGTRHQHGFRVDDKFFYLKTENKKV